MPPICRQRSAFHLKASVRECNATRTQLAIRGRASTTPWVALKHRQVAL